MCVRDSEGVRLIDENSEGNPPSVIGLRRVCRARPGALVPPRWAGRGCAQPRVGPGGPVPRQLQLCLSACQRTADPSPVEAVDAVDRTPSRTGSCRRGRRCRRSRSRRSACSLVPLYVSDLHGSVVGSFMKCPNCWTRLLGAFVTRSAQLLRPDLRLARCNSASCGARRGEGLNCSKA